MEFPPPSPATSPVSVQVVQASDDLSASAVWDWGNLLDFAIETDDSSLLPWDTPDLPYPLSPRPQLAEAEIPADPPPVLASTAVRSKRVRKRDPRLVCANYLAGRVPCACPEMDEKELEGDEEELVLGGRKRARAGVVKVAVRCQVVGCEADIKELKGYHRRHRVCLRCANASSVMLDGEEKRYCQQCGKFHVLLDFDEGKRSCRRKLEKHNRRRRRKPIDSINVVEKDNRLEGVFLDTDQLQETPKRSENNNTIDGEMFLDSENGNGFPGSSFNGLEQAQTSSPLSVAASADARVDGRKDLSKSTFSSTICDNKTSYLSMCPTGRISFKLYDWNPAEFPRRLRHQIFQWLASMPVELEGYIRPGCTILTIFIAMPQHMWEKLSKDGAFYIKQLINSPESLLCERGNIIIYLNSMIVHVLKDGTSHIKMEVNAPRLHYVHPTFFEAGKAMEFIACGTNLDHPRLRFLVSFAGKYLVCDACRVTSTEKVRCYGVNSVVSTGHEMFRINIKQTPPEVFGPAFIEVENQSGISNYIPILIGDKNVCSELKNLRVALRHSPKFHEHTNMSNAVFTNAAFSEVNVTMADLLVDIAWVLKEPSKDYTKTFLGSLNVQRLKHMLQFSMQNELISVIKAILKYVGIMIHEIGFQDLKILTVSADFAELLECVRTAEKFLNQRIQHKERLKLDSVHSNFMEALPINLVDNAMIITTTNLVEEDRKTNPHALVSTTVLLSSDGDENASLISKDITRSMISFLHLHSYFPSKHWITNMLAPPIIRRWPALFVMASFVMCFIVCIILLEPHKASDFGVFMGRCSLRSSNL